MKNQKLFDKYKDQKHWHEHPEKYAQIFADFLKERGVSGRIVDLGCGNGRDVEIFARQGFSCLGIDKDKKEIVEAKKLHPGCNFEVQNIENLSWANDYIDAYFMINVIHYLEERKALSEIFRTLKLGGYFYLHINLSITDKNGQVDYKGQSLDKIIKAIPKANIVWREYLERIDLKPIWHKHQILEIILKKI